MHEVCCGLEVHKKSGVACEPWASGRRRQTGELGTFRKDLFGCSDWFGSCGVTAVASEWIADLRQHGLLRASFLPLPPIRELRDLTRYRASLAHEVNRITNRVQKVLEDANIGLASVPTNAPGASGRAMLEAMIKGQQESCYILQDKVCHRDLDPDYFDRPDPEGLRRRLTKRGKGLGFKVTLEWHTGAAWRAFSNP
jgi:hypothetical protein